MAGWRWLGVDSWVEMAGCRYDWVEMAECRWRAGVGCTLPILYELLD